jgi:hypothetical protein
MGVNIKVLGERAVDQTLYYGHECNLELRECFHDHVEDFRLVYDKDEFLQMSDHWIKAREEYDKMGQPEAQEQNISLSTTVLDGQRLHHERAALEFTQGGADRDGGGDTIHFHYRHCRIHLTKRDFFRLGALFSEALRCYEKHFSTVVDLRGPDVVLRDVAKDVYIPWLLDYIKEDVPRANPDDYWDLFLKHKDLLRPEEIQRPDGGFLKDQPRTRNVPEEEDKRYLYTMFECIKKYGYGEGPFRYDYIRAQPTGDGKLELTGSHRAACLWLLGYDEIPVVITN